MAIIQISKVQQRSGDLVDLPQLDNAEFGLANDARRLFIGNDSNVTGVENIEVLTSYSNVSFSQIDGAVGNLDISNASVANGQVLAYDGDNWVNRGGDAGGLLTLGNVANVKMTGGALGYVLETDGTGNLSFTPKSTIIAYISNVTQANPAVVTTTQNNFFTTGLRITVTDVNGMTQLNGNDYYISVLTSNTFSLYSDSGLATPVNSTGYGTYTSNGRAISSITGSGSAGAGGANTTVQYNQNNLLNGSASFTFDYNASPKVLSVVGNANVSNLNATSTVTASQLVSNIATGTAPFIVTSTTQVANLNVANAGYATTAGTATTATTATSATSATTAGTVTTAAQPNITSVSTSFTTLTFTDSQSIIGNNITLSTGSSSNSGTITGNWSLSAGSLLQSTYADLAEYYEADQEYEEGTVLEFGGEKEVTLAEDSTTRVAGVVSTNPAYAMNAKCPGISTPIALQGRVPVKVRGKVRDRKSTRLNSSH